MTKPAFDKDKVLTTALVLAVSLAIIMLAPALIDVPRPSLAQGLAQAAAIAVVFGIVQAFSGRDAEVETDEASTADQDGAGPRDDIDALTHGPNQRGLTVRLLELMAVGERYGNSLSFAVIDIDHYEDVVEKYGHDVADRALVAISSELADSIRMPDVVGRWAQDQFVAILPETPLDGARHIGERLREAVSRAQFEAKRGVVLSLTASIGVTVYRPGDDLHSLLTRASRAADTARSQGRDRVSTDLAA